jgi:hypothetical protein
VSLCAFVNCVRENAAALTVVRRQTHRPAGHGVTNDGRSRHRSKTPQDAYCWPTEHTTTPTPTRTHTTPAGPARGFTRMENEPSPCTLTRHSLSLTPDYSRVCVPSSSMAVAQWHAASNSEHWTPGLWRPVAGRFVSLACPLVGNLETLGAETCKQATKAVLARFSTLISNLTPIATGQDGHPRTSLGHP